MRIGLISDIHANLPALEAVLDDIPRVDDIVCAGDVVGYNPWPAECLKRVREVASVSVQGNHDRTVDTPSRYAANPMAEAGLEHAQSVLDDEQMEWLATRPKRTTIAGTAEAFLEWTTRLNGTISFVVGDHDHEVLTTLDDVTIFEHLQFGHQRHSLYCIHDPEDAPRNWAEWLVHGHHHNNWPDKYPF